MIISLTSLSAQNDITVFTSDNKDGKITTSIESEFKKAGFTISANRDMNTPFKIYNLFTFYKKDILYSICKLPVQKHILKQELMHLVRYI